MRVEATRRINASRDAVWDWVGDLSRYDEFMADVMRWEQAADVKTGCGSRWNMRIQVGSAPVGGLIEVVEYDEPGDLAWTGVTGIEQRGRWRLRERQPGCTEVTLRISFSSPGGFLRYFVERLAAPRLRGSLQRTLGNLAARVEGSA